MSAAEQESMMAIAPEAEESQETSDRGLLPPLEVDDVALEAGIEGILFIADDAVATVALVETLGVDAGRVGAALERLRERYGDRAGGISLVEVAGGWRLLTGDAARTVLERWLVGSRSGRLTQAALETLAVIAYRQPIGRTTIGEIRGVNPDGALRSLIARGLVAEVGRDEGPGQATLFGTTSQFLTRMGLRSLDDLPALPAYLPDGPAPDEPDASGLADLRRRLREGSQRLGDGDARQTRFEGAGAFDESDDDDGGMPGPRAARPRDDEEIGVLSDRLEQAARSAMGRLRTVAAAQAAAEPPEDGSDGTSDDVRTGGEADDDRGSDG